MHQTLHSHWHATAPDTQICLIQIKWHVEGHPALEYTTTGSFYTGNSVKFCQLHKNHSSFFEQFPNLKAGTQEGKWLTTTNQAAERLFSVGHESNYRFQSFLSSFSLCGISNHYHLALSINYQMTYKAIWGKKNHATAMLLQICIKYKQIILVSSMSDRTHSWEIFHTFRCWAVTSGVSS